MAEPLVVVGGSVAGLVAAREAARLGRDVDLLVPGGHCGRGFVDLKLDGRRLRAGVRLLELAYTTVDDDAPLDQYEPGPAGHARHMALVRRTILELVGGEVREAPVPLLAMGGRIGPDVHMTTDLRSLPSLLDERALAAIAEEARTIEATTRPAGVFDDPTVDPWSLAFDVASVANHGATFHRLVVAPIAAKIIEGGAARIATALRRKAWLALFHPRTLREAAAGDPVGYAPHRPFHVDRSGGCSALVTALVEAVRGDRRIRVRTVGRLADLTVPGEVRFDDGESVPCERPVLAVPAADRFAASGAAYDPRLISVTITWVEVAEDEVLHRPSAVLLADADVSAYRVSEGGTGRPGTVVFAIEHGPLATVEVGAPADALERAGLVRDGAGLRVVHQARASAGVAPSPEAAASFAAAAAVADDRAAWVVPIAGAAALGADSCNEQIIAGVYAGRRAAA